MMVLGHTGVSLASFVVAKGAIIVIMLLSLWWLYHSEETSQEIMTSHQGLKCVNIWLIEQGYTNPVNIPHCSSKD